MKKERNNENQKQFNKRRIEEDEKQLQLNKQRKHTRIQKQNKITGKKWLKQNEISRKRDFCKKKKRNEENKEKKPLERPQNRDNRNENKIDLNYF